MEIFYLTTSTPGLTQELRKLCDWPESIILELKGNCKKKKINQSKPNSLSSKKIQSQAEKDTQRLSRNNNGKTYIMFKILPEFG